MTEVQRLIKEMLVEIDQICKKENIEYYLEGGTALGALRHGGFLPWDDDADITMTRKNWEKFRDYVIANPIENRAIVSAETSSEYPTITNRYVNTSTTRIFRSLMYDICPCGVAIDIFVLEDAPDDDALLEQMKYDMIDYCEYICLYYRICSFGDSDRYSKQRLKGKLIGRQKMSKILDDKIKKYNGIDSKRYLMRWPYRFQVYDKELFGKPTYVKFEDTYLPIPEKKYEYMNVHYGVDWYIIPEEENIDTHDTVCDDDICYQEYVSDYMSFIDKKKAIAVNQKYKDLGMKVLKYNKAFYRDIYSAAGDCTVFILKKKLSEGNIDIDKEFSVINDETRRKFYELFSDYLRKQLNNEYLLYGVRLPIDDNILGVVIAFLIKDGKLRDAEKLLDMRTQESDPMEGKLVEVLNDYNNLKDTTALFFNRKFKEAADMVKSTDEEHMLSPIQIAISCHDSLDNEDLEVLKKRLLDNYKLYPEEDTFMFTYAHALLKQGNNEDAGRVFKEIKEKTKNGMLILWIENDETAMNAIEQYSIK